MTDLVRVALRDGVTVLTMDDGKANALGHPMIEALDSALAQAEEAGHPVILAGREGKFCGGFDLVEMMSGAEAAVSLVTRAVGLLVRIYTLPLPVIAACTGHALAGGALLLLTADERIGINGPYKVGLNEVRIGIPLPHLGRVLARERLDPRQLTRATCGARIYTPASAVDVGFLDQVVAEGELMERALAEAKELGQFLTEAYAKTKLGLREDTAQSILASVKDDIRKMLPSALT